jgi:predicted phage replisome organizer
MADVKWIKICTDIFDDEKMTLLDVMPEHDAIIVIWFKLLCMAGKQNNGGVFMFNDKIAYTDEMLATIFRRPINIVRLALQTFEKFGMIEIVNNAYTIPNWEKHQNLDKLEKLKEQNRLRVAKHREKQKLLSSDEECNVTVMECNATDKIRLEEDKNRIDKDIDIEEDKPKRKRFVPPTLEEVQDYCFERNNNVDAERFINHYTSNGWMVGKNKMKDWKAAIRTWEKSNYGNISKKQNQQTQQQGTGNVFVDMLIERGEFMDKECDIYNEPN